MIKQSSPAKKIFFPRVLYLGDRHFFLYPDGRREPVDDNTLTSCHVPLVIIGKKYYFETFHHFSFSKNAEIAAAIQMDMGAYSPYCDGRFFFRKIQENQEGTLINLWFLDTQLSTLIKQFSPLFILPETVLFSEHEGNSAQIGRICSDNGTAQLIHVSENGLLKTIFATDEQGEMDRFRRIIGAEASSCSVTEVRGQDRWFDLLATAFYQKIPLKKLVPFFDGKSLFFSQNKKYLIQGLLTVAVLLILYGAGIWLLTGLAQSRLQDQDQVLNGQVGHLLAKMEKVEAEREKLQLYTATLNAFQSKSSLLVTLANNFDSTTRIDQLEAAGQHVEIRGVATDPPSLLEKLAATGWIHEARFVSPLVKDKADASKERFHISFVLSGTARSAPASEGS